MRGNSAAIISIIGQQRQSIEPRRILPTLSYSRKSHGRCLLEAGLPYLPISIGREPRGIKAWAQLGRLPVLVEGGRDKSGSSGSHPDRAKRGYGWAQYARPVDVAPARPVAPAPTVIAPSPGCCSADAAAARANDHQSAHGLVPGPPAAVAEGGKARPRKCCCYLVNAVTKSRRRSACDESCCKGDKQDEGC